MKVIINRFEGKFAVCEKENWQMLDIEKYKIPVTAKEGDVLNITNDIITIDIETTKKRKKQIEDFAKDLWKWINITIYKERTLYLYKGEINNEKQKRFIGMFYYDFYNNA